MAQGLITLGGRNDTHGTRALRLHKGAKEPDLREYKNEHPAFSPDARFVVTG